MSCAPANRISSRRGNTRKARPAVVIALLRLRLVRGRGLALIRTAASRHEDQSPPPRLSGCSACSEETFAKKCGNEKDAPTAAVRAVTNEPLSSDERRSGAGVSVVLCRRRKPP